MFFVFRGTKYDDIGPNHTKEKKKAIKTTTKQPNIARGTTDPGYWVFSLNYISDWDQFEISISQDNFFSQDNFSHEITFSHETTFSH